MVDIGAASRLNRHGRWRFRAPASHTIAMRSTPGRLEAGEVRVWYAPADDLGDPGVTHTALGWLTARERERYDRLHHVGDRRMFLLGRVMARSLVGAALGVPPTAWEWREGPHGRPEIAAPTPLRFNLSHSAGLVVCALAPDRDVGVDVEDLSRRHVDAALVRRYCSPDEIADIERHGAAWHERFLRHWTLKEAYLKARGLGISVPLEHVAFRMDHGRIDLVLGAALACEDARWRFLLAEPTERHLVAVAVSTIDGLTPQIRLARLTGYLPAPPARLEEPSGDRA